MSLRNDFTTWIKSPLTLIAIASAGLVATILGLVPLVRWDAWFDLTVGRIIDAFGAVPAANHTVYTLDEKAPSLFPSWLAQWLMYRAHSILDLEAVLWVRNHLYAIAVLLVGLACGKRASSEQSSTHPTLMWGPLIGVFILSMATLIPWAMTGPQMFAAPLWALMWFLAMWSTQPGASAWRARAAGALMVVCAALWANLDVSFGLSVIIGVWVAVTQKRHGASRWWAWLVVSALCALASALNPRGLELIPYALQSVVGTINHPRSLTWMTLKPWDGVSGVLFWTAGVVALMLSLRSKRWMDAILVVVLVAIGASHARAAIWFALAMPIFCVSGLSRPSDAQATKPVRWQLVLTIVALANIVPILTQPIFLTHAPIASAVPGIARRGVQPHTTTILAEVPLEAVEMIRRQMSPGQRLYVDHRATGYVLFELQPKQPYPMVQADARLTMLPQKMWTQQSLLEQSDIWRGLFQLWGVDFALLHKTRQAKLIDMLKAHKKWSKSYEDERWVYFSVK